MLVCCILVPPEAVFEPSLTRGNPKTMPHLAGSYLENTNEDFTCSIRNVLPGKDSTSFEFYYGSKLRLQSKNGAGEIVEKDEGDGTKSVEWKFTTFLNRNDNGGNCRCSVDWKAGQYEEMGLRSKLVDHLNVTCTCQNIYTKLRLENKDFVLR